MKTRIVSLALLMALPLALLAQVDMKETIGIIKKSLVQSKANLKNYS